MLRSSCCDDDIERVIPRLAKRAEGPLARSVRYRVSYGVYARSVAAVVWVTELAVERSFAVCAAQDDMH